MVFENINFLDINFYATIPIWIYIVSGFGLIFLVNFIVICCCCIPYKRKKQKLHMRELELKKKEINFEIKLEKEKQRDEYEGITLTRPAMYKDICRDI